MNFIITNHAFERIKERSDKNLFQILAEDAWKNGKSLSNAENKKMFYIGIGDFKEDYLLNDYKKYKGMIFVFRRIEKDVALKTVMREGMLWEKEYTLPQKTWKNRIKKFGYWDFTKPNPKRIKIKI